MVSSLTHSQEVQPAEQPIPPVILYFLLALALVRGIIYASVVPPWQAPDEPAQFERVRASLTTEEWNSTSENGPNWYAELRDSLLAFHWANYLAEPVRSTPGAPLGEYIVLYHETYGGLYGSRFTYALIGLPLFLARDQDITLQLYLVRLFTVLMNAGIIWLAYLITRTIYPGNIFLTLGVPILILFNPQHTHILSTVNNGNLAELFVAIALYFIVKGIVHGFSWFNLGALLGFSLMAMWTKATAYFLVATLGSIGLFYVWAYRRQWRSFVLGTILLVGLIYSFAPLRFKQLIWEGGSFLSRADFHLDPFVLSSIFRSFWAMPGWLIVRLDPFWYWLLALACGLALAGITKLLLTKWRLLLARQVQPPVRALVVLGVSIVAAVAIQVGWHILTGTLAYNQGRSIYPVIIPITIFLLLGWQQLIPVTWQKSTLLTLTVACLGFDTMVLFAYIIPFFYSRY